MNVYKLVPDVIPALATMMSALKPEWWDYEGAYGQLTNIEESIKTIGWYCTDDTGKPNGWILCRELLGYNALELECSGFNDNGVFKLEHKLEPLMEVAEEYAKEKGYLTFRSGISSVGFNIDGQDIPDIADAIKTLHCTRIDYLWYLKHGFRVIGIQPNAYEKGSHLILLGKDIS